WLEGLGKVTTNYRTGVMEFNSGEHRVTLKASKDGGTKEVGLKSIEQVWHMGGQIFTVEKASAHAGIVEQVKYKDPPLFDEYFREVEQVSTDYDGPPIIDVYPEDELMDVEVIEEAEVEETKSEGKVQE
ncbi:Unknown protein, partial [Striga hermonthica]